MRPGRRRFRWRSLLAGGLLALTGSAWAGLPLQTVTRGLAPPQQEATRQLLEAVSQRLPPSWRSGIDPRIRLQWRSDLPPRTHGRAWGRHLWLDRALLDGWMAQPDDAGADSPARRAAMAALIHELAHLHDRSAGGRLSRDPRLRDLAGWQVSPLRWRSRAAENRFVDRSPDRYELTRPSEFVAVNLEYFLLDPEYACRRPALFRYFAAHFSWAPEQAACAPDLVFLESETGSGDASLLALEPARVYAVDYLLAEGNEEAMSRWGHSMLRLVICAPDRPPGPDCRWDLQYHRVLSFRAFVGDVQISGWRGLTGSYPSRLYLLPLAQVIEEYAKTELRGLQSIPLRLRKDEIAGLLERAAQVHWSYDGRYYFLSNNCAVETWKLLHDGVPRLAAEPLGSITPTGLLRRLRRSDIADVSVLGDRAEAMRQGYYFEPLSARYQTLFEVAKDAFGLPQQTVRQWLELEPEQRARWMPRAELKAGAALLVLEQAALRRQRLLIRDELKRRYLETGALPPSAVEAGRLLQKLLEGSGFFSRPAELIGQGYGLPQVGEREAAAKEGAVRAERLRGLERDLHERIGQWVAPDQQRRLEAIESNLEMLGARLRQLHQAQAGAPPRRR